MNKKPKIFISIVTYRSTDDTLTAIKCLMKLGIKPHDIFVWNNETLPSEKKDLTEHLPKGVHAYFSKPGLGFAGGHDSLIKKGLKLDYDYFFILNPDVIITQKNFFSTMIDAMNEYNAGIAAPLMVYMNNRKKVHFASGKINKYTYRTIMQGKDTYVDDFSKKIIECDFVSGAAMMVRKEVFQTIGLIPTDYFLYFEESDFCVKARRAGFKVIVCQKAKVMHAVSKSIGYLSKFYLYYMIRNYRIFATKYINRLYLPLFWSYYLLVWVPGYLFLTIKQKNIKGAWYVTKGFLNIPF